jgi:hypothetical protein
MAADLTLFDTPQERTAREYNEFLAAYMDARAVPGGWQCQDCGGIARTQTLFWNSHGIMGSRCLAERFARNHTIHDLRDGDRARYIGSSARLRAIAAWKAARRRILAEGPPF